MDMETNLVGTGRFGSVYRGTINDDDGDEQTSVAMKVLNLDVRGTSKSLATECNALRGLRHRNLEGKILRHRFEYLHCGTDSSVIHGDLKSSNILLDQGMVTHRISQDHIKHFTQLGSSSAAIKGTKGYIVPEYGMSSMFTNIRPTSSDELEGRINLQDFVSNALPDPVIEVVDPFLHQELNRGDKYRVCIVSILSIGVRCSKEFPRDRLSMAEVVNELKRIRNGFLECNRRRAP
ncbi:hypothetical protein C2S51_012879 [Perilla frutescens var. frutescens]|nr:hypothetical protein C2S51_012879 [Perilla frutescens var. frutescens]